MVSVGGTPTFTVHWKNLDEQNRELLLRQLNDSPNILWVLLGDFNEIVYSFEKR